MCNRYELDQSIYLPTQIFVKYICAYIVFLKLF